MRFLLNDSHLILEKTVKNFGQKYIAPKAAFFDQTHTFPKEVISGMADLGLMGVFMPEKFGGAGLDVLSYVIALEEISSFCASSGVIMSVNNSLFCDTINRFGTDEQKEKYITPFALGQKLGSYALTEPNNGSDAAAMSTTAKRDGDFYVLNGTKAWITNGYEANACIVFASLDISLKHKGIIALIVDLDSKGITLGKKEQKLGIRASSTCNIIFEDVKVPIKNRLKEEGEGFSIAMSVLDGGRIGIAAQALGISKAAFEVSLKYTGERKAFGKYLKELPSIQNKIADMALKIESSRLLVYQAAMMKDRGLSFTKEASMAKLFASEASTFITHQAMQIFGGNGYVEDYPCERHYRDARITEIYEGTSEIQRLVIANRVIKEFCV